MEKWERCADMVGFLIGRVHEMDEILGRLADTAIDLVRPRVLTLDEVKEWKDAVWVEEKNGALYPALIKKVWEDRRVIGVIDCSEHYTTSSCEFDDYGRLDRYWTRKPTEELREETPWREKKTEGTT